MFEAKIAKEDQTDVMASFWTMMMTLESAAENQLDRHFVEGYFRQWNRVMNDNKEPRWFKEPK